MTDRHRHRISVYQPPASGVGGKSWEQVWSGNNALRAALMFLLAALGRQGRQLKLEWGRSETT